MRRGIGDLQGVAARIWKLELAPTVQACPLAVLAVVRGCSGDGRLRVIHALIVHSPLVGPTTISALADALVDRGWSTVAPDLRQAVSSPQTFAAAASHVTDDVEVIVGHSGAGAVLPVIAHDVGAAVMVFIDAVVPDPTTTFRASDGFVALLDQLPVADGLLPPWHEWWPPEILARLVPDERVRAAVAAEMPALPRSFYDEPVALPGLWWRRPAGFVQLSPAYDEERSRAELWGWPTCRLDGHHLDLLTRPSDVADAVVLVANAAQRPRE